MSIYLSVNVGNKQTSKPLKTKTKSLSFAIELDGTTPTSRFEY